MTRPIRAAAVLAALVVGWLLAPTSIGGPQSYVTTYGNSMEPGFHAGDLGVLRVAGSYAVGDIVGYRSATLNAVVLHRIVARDGDTFTMKGDHNSWLDVDHPSPHDITGRLVLRVPQGGASLRLLLSAPGLVAVLLGLAVAAALGRTRGRRRRSRHAGALRPIPPPAAVLARVERVSALRAPSERQAIALTAAGVLAMLGLALGATAWLGPVTPGPAPPVAAPRSMSFSYVAAVPGTPAFDGTAITSPDPVFRKLASLVTLYYGYRGEPGTIQVDARLYGQSGWHSTLPLTGPMPFSGLRFDGRVQLDLSAIDRRARAAAAATGSSDEMVGLEVVPRVTLQGGTTFAPSLKFSLTRQQLTLTDPKALVVTDAAARAPANPPRSSGSVTVLGRGVSVTVAGRVALALFGLALALVALLATGAARGRPPDEVTVIRRRYGQLLVATKPVDAPPDRPVVEVTDFATLAKLAARYGLLVMHWHLEGTALFEVWDEATRYRYRVDLPPPRRLSRRRRRATRAPRPAARWRAGRAGRPTTAAPAPPGPAVSPWARPAQPPPGPPSLLPFAPASQGSSLPAPSRPVRPGTPAAAARRAAPRQLSEAERQLLAWRQSQRLRWADARARAASRTRGPALPTSAPAVDLGWPADWRIPVQRTGSPSPPRSPVERPTGRVPGQPQGQALGRPLWDSIVHGS